MDSDRPILRPLEGYPIQRDGKMFLKLRDASRLSDFEATLPPEAVAVVELFDGHSSRDEICAQFEKRYRQPLPREALDQLIDQLDQALLLDTERFRQYSTGVFAEFQRSPLRMPIFAGQSYPQKPAELAAAFDSYLAPPRGPGRPTTTSARRPNALIVPHVDFQRGGPAYAFAYQPLLASVDDPPDLIIVLGTNHSGVRPFTLTRKHFETPLGRMHTDIDLVDALVADPADEDARFAEEHHHRGEHSLEFQMCWLRYVYGARADQIKVLPILCGSYHEHIASGKPPGTDAEVGSFLAKFGAILGERGQKVLWIAAADLAHVGPRYGDESALSEIDCASLEARDGKTLEPVLAGDASGWFEEIRREGDRRRVCGLSPIYSMLEAAHPGVGRLAVYAQCPAEQGSIVSIASVVYPGN